MGPSTNKSKILQHAALARQSDGREVSQRQRKQYFNQGTGCPNKLLVLEITNTTTISSFRMNYVMTAIFIILELCRMNAPSSGMLNVYSILKLYACIQCSLLYLRQSNTNEYVVNGCGLCSNAGHTSRSPIAMWAPLRAKLWDPPRTTSTYYY